MNKFNVGDRVRIKGYDWWSDVTNKMMYKRFIANSINNSQLLVNEEMIGFLGKSATITNVEDLGYRIKIDAHGETNFLWPESSLEKIKNDKDNIDWSQYRSYASLFILKELISNLNPQDISDSDINLYTNIAVITADSLIDKLKK